MKFVLDMIEEKSELFVYVGGTGRKTSVRPESTSWLLEKGHIVEVLETFNYHLPLCLHGHEEITWTGSPDQVYGVLVFDIGGGRYSTNFRRVPDYNGKMPLRCYFNGFLWETIDLCFRKRGQEGYFSTFMYHNFPNVEYAYESEGLIRGLMELTYKVQALGGDPAAWKGKSIRWLTASGLSATDAGRLVCYGRYFTGDACREI